MEGEVGPGVAPAERPLIPREGGTQTIGQKQRHYKRGKDNEVVLLGSTQTCPFISSDRHASFVQASIGK